METTKKNQVIGRLMDRWSDADDGATTISRELLADAIEALRHSVSALAKQAEAAPVGAMPTDISKRLRECADAVMLQEARSKLMMTAADECERFYGGMVAWKETAQMKDRTIIELRAALAQRAGSEAKPQEPFHYYGLSAEQLQQLLGGCLKPEEISGEHDVQHDRVHELVWWFARFTQGNANPKWAASHACELAYFIATNGVNRHIDLKEVRNAAFKEGVNITPAERGTLERIGFATPRPVAPPSQPDSNDKAMHWFDCLNQCAKLLKLDDETPIPSGVVDAVKALVSQPDSGRDAALIPCTCAHCGNKIGAVHKGSCFHIHAVTQEQCYPPSRQDDNRTDALRAAISNLKVWASTRSTSAPTQYLVDRAEVLAAMAAQQGETGGAK